MSNILNLLWFALFQTYFPMQNEVNITTVDVKSYVECADSSGIKHLEFISSEGHLQLEIEKIYFTKVSYTVASSVSGTYFLLCPVHQWWEQAAVCPYL